MLGGLKVKLDDITNYIQSICENICTVLDVDVTVVSKDLIRIAGTGVFKDKIYEKISDHSAFSKVLKSQKPYIINRDLEDNCKTCVHKEDCKELVDICSPIMLGSDNLGILGIAAFTEEQKNTLITKINEKYGKEISTNDVNTDTANAIVTYSSITFELSYDDANILYEVENSGEYSGYKLILNKRTAEDGE